MITSQCLNDLIHIRDTALNNNVLEDETVKKKQKGNSGQFNTTLIGYTCILHYKFPERQILFVNIKQTQLLLYQK